MKAFWVVLAMGAVVAAAAPAEVHASTGSAGLLSSDVLTGLVIALCCALFSAALRRLPSS
ncbi:MAG TPA: hypothetical protein VFN67_05480 [Polyangiales bacterium]|nr:hypothetical protein [Polyangiales bacterium]